MHVVARPGFAGMRNDVGPFARVGSGYDGHHGFGVAQVINFMGYARFDVNKIAGFVINRVF